jgi:endonuclease-3
MKIEEIIGRLRENYQTRPYLRDPFEVLITTILSQRTKDENTAKASARLFSVYKTPREIADAEEEELQELIKPSGFYRVKAGRIKEVSKAILERYGGQVPEDVGELLKLPGVGRKTANCVLVYGFGKEAIPVDVHVEVVAKRLGLVDKDADAIDVEKQMQRVVPKRYWTSINELLVQFGRDICRTRNPKCRECFIKDLCDHWR